MITHREYLEAQKIVDAYHSQLKQSVVNTSDLSINQMVKRNYPESWDYWVTEIQGEDVLSLSQLLATVQKEYEKSLTQEYVSRSLDHSAIVFRQIYVSTNDYINLYCGDLNGDIFSNYLYILGLNTLFKNKVKFRVLIENSLKIKSNSVLYNLLSVNKNKFNIRKSKVLVSDDKNNKIHFIISDGTTYRIEYNTKNYESIYSFNGNKSIIENLNQIFEDIWINYSEELNIFINTTK